MPGYTDPCTFLRGIEQAARQRRAAASVRTREAAARRAAVAALRADGEARRSVIHGDLEDLRHRRHFIRRRIREEMRAQLLSLNADMERLHGEVRTRLTELRRNGVGLAADHRGRRAEVCAGLAAQSRRRRACARGLLEGFSKAGVERTKRIRRQLADARAELRRVTADTLGALRAERIRRRAAWEASRERRGAEWPVAAFGRTAPASRTLAASARETAGTKPLRQPEAWPCGPR